MTDAQRLDRFLAALRGAHRDMVPLFTEGCCFELFVIARTVFPRVEPLYSQREGHVYLALDGRLFDIRGRHAQRPADLGPLNYRRAPGRQPHRWAKANHRRLCHEGGNQ